MPALRNPDLRAQRPEPVTASPFSAGCPTVVAGACGCRALALTRHGVLVLTWLAVTLLAPGLAEAASTDPAGVVMAYATARMSGDTEAMLAVFADNAVIIDRLGYPHTGREEVRRML